MFNEETDLSSSSFEDSFVTEMFRAAKRPIKEYIFSVRYSFGDDCVLNDIVRNREKHPKYINANWQKIIYFLFLIFPNKTLSPHPVSYLMGAKSIIKNAIGSILLVWIFASFLLFNLNQLEERKYHASALNPFHATENPNPSKLHPLTKKGEIATENLKNEHTDFQRFLEDHPELELEQSRAAYQIEQNEQKRVNAPHHVQIQNLETKPLRNTTSTLNGAPNTILENQVTIKDLRKSAVSAAAAAAAAAAAMSPEAAAAAAAAAVLAAEFEDQGDETSRFHLALAKLRDHEIQAEAEINEKKVVLHKQCAESGRRVYKVGRRHDFQGSISDALDTLDLCKREKGDKRPFDFYWDKQFMDDEVERYLDKEIADNGMVSSIPGFRETIGIKPSLARLHRECIKHHKNRKELCSFTKRAFNFHRHYKTLNVEAGIQEFTKFAQQVSERSERALTEECVKRRRLTHSCSRASLKMRLTSLGAARRV